MFVSGSAGDMATSDRQRVWTADRAVISGLVVATCLGVAMFSLSGKGWQVGVGDAVLIGLASAAALLPYARRESAVASEAQLSARVARVYCGLIAALSMTWGGYDMIYRHGRALLKLSRADRPVPIDEYIAMLEVDEEIDPEIMPVWRNNIIEHVEQIAREELVDLIEDDDGNKLVIVNPEWSAAIIHAFAHYTVPR